MPHTQSDSSLNLHSADARFSVDSELSVTIPGAARCSPMDGDSIKDDAGSDSNKDDEVISISSTSPPRALNSDEA